MRGEAYFWTCRFCGWVFPTYLELDLHQAFEHGPPPRRVALWRRVVRATVDWLRGES